MIRIVDKRASAQTFSRFTNEDCDWDSDGEMLVHDDEGYITNDYIPSGSLPASYWEEMLSRM